jgi:hypothetical protein
LFTCDIFFQVLEKYTSRPTLRVSVNPSLSQSHFTVSAKASPSFTLAASSQAYALLLA